MKNLLFQLWIGDTKNNPVHRPSVTSMERYAKRMGADYKFFNEHIWDSTFLPQFQCLWMFEEEQDDYDIITYVDADIIVRVGATGSIFTETMGHALNFAYRDSYRQWHQKAAARTPECPVFTNVPGFNGGVYRFTRDDRIKLRPYIHEAKKICQPHCFHDEGLLHVAMGMANFQPNILEDKWNYRFEYPQFPGRNVTEANFIHIMHDKKNLYKILKKNRIVS